MSSFAQVEEKKEKKDKVIAPPEKQTVQRDLSDVNGPEGGMLPGDVSAKIQSMRGSGQKLSERQNQYFSQKFGRDMSDVHVHTDAASDTISRSLNARAFTIGSDVFLTKGVNPDGGGSSMQTMTHELTHVVQQGGHASAGPLKLGAADTAQEHEAESTAQREFDPKQKEDEDGVQREYEAKYRSSNTIQRGFWSDFGSALGGAALNAIGLGDAMGDFMSGDSKVKTAISKMNSGQKSAFDLKEKNIKDLEKRQIPDIKKKIKQETNEEAQEQDPDRKKEIQKKILQDQDTQKSLESQLQNWLKGQYDMLHGIDATITNEDINRYRSGKAKTFFSSIFSAIGGNVLGAFEKDPEKKAEAQARGRNSINNWFASKNKYTLDMKGSEEREAERAEELKQKQNDLIDEIWNDIQNDQQLSGRYTKLLFKREIAKNHMSMIQESLKEGESKDEIKQSVIMMLRNNAPAGGGAQVQQSV